VTRDVVSRLSTFCHKDVVFSALVSNLARSAPFFALSIQEVEENKIESWEKEISASLGLDRLPVLDYSVWFSDEDLDSTRALSTFLPPAPSTNRRIREGFRYWASTMTGALLFPQVQSNKTMSRGTASRYWSIVEQQETGNQDSEVSSSHVERMYALTGIETQGPCELRQAWKYNDLTPRTYFSQGGKVFGASKYIRQVMNTLVNVFPESNFITRFSINDVELTSMHTAFIYDYSSFTSNFTEFKYFLDALADYCEDVPIRVVDSRQGVINWTLGGLIREYNQVCNKMGDFSAIRYTGEHTVFQHSRAGFLGVYGNIAGSTCLHALHAANLVGDSGGSKCVGDDAYGARILNEMFSRSDLVSAIQSLGEVNEQKINIWNFIDIEDEGDDDHGWQYTKRPIDRLHNRVQLEQALFLPIFGLVNPIPDGVHESPREAYERVKILAQQTFSLIRQCRQLYPPLDEPQKGLLRKYLGMLYMQLGMPREGRLPFESSRILDLNVSGLLIPSLREGFLDEDPWSLLEDRFTSRASVLVTIPKMSLDRVVRLEEILRESGNPVESCMDHRLSYLVNMGWMLSRGLDEIRYMDYPEYQRFYNLLFAGSLNRLYECRIVDSCPRWINELV
jgi:hypothetical protein